MRGETHTHSPSDTAAPVQVEVACGPDDLLAAFRLVYERFVAEGNACEHPSGLRVTPWDALPGTVRIVARQDGQLTGTLGLVPDSAFGLPVESLAGDALREIRAIGGTPCEACGLAMSTQPHDMWAGMHLFRYGLLIARRHLAATDLVFAVDPCDVFFDRVQT